jgi:hypothetical protein
MGVLAAGRRGSVAANEVRAYREAVFPEARRRLSNRTQS